MLQFRNDTGFPGTLFVSPDPAGVETVYAVVKATFVLGASPILAEEQVPITLEAVHHGEPAESSIKVPSDVSLEKPGTDVVLVGHAYGPGGRPVQYVDVTVSVGPLRRVVRAFGDRSWTSDGVGYRATAPEPFEAMPLVWERAYGGVDMVGGEPCTETRNPVGRGFRDEEGERELEGLALPNLEDPYQPITSWKQRPEPACFAPVAPHWEPRRTYAGTYDEEWQRTRAPYLPTDFDPRFFHIAPRGLAAQGFLQGGEPVVIEGASPHGTLAFELPRVAVRTVYRLDGEPVERAARLDTVILEPDEGRLLLVWRSALSCDKRTLRVHEVRAEVVG